VFDQAKLYISRGVGMTMLPLRFDCPPEVAHFTLRRGAAVPRRISGASGRAVDTVIHAARAVAHRLS